MTKKYSSENGFLSGKIIGRKREQEILKKVVHSKKAEFVAVYGRKPQILF